MSDTTPTNLQQPQATNDTSHVEQALNPGIKEMPGYRSSEAVEIKARIKPRIELFLSYAHADNRLKQRLLAELLSRLETSIHFHFVLSSDNDLLCGERWHDELQDRLARCDYGILLLSSHFLASPYIRKHEVPPLDEKAFPVCLRRIDLDNQEILGFDKRQIFFFDGKPFEKVGGTNHADFVNDFVEQIEKSILKQRGKKDEIICYETKENEIECVNFDDERARKLTEGHLKFKGALYEYERFIDGRATKGIISHQASESSADTVQARPYILSWALESEAPFFALLGDFGTGKTFTCRMLAREINAKHDETPESVPLCIYIDLRRVLTRIDNKVPRLTDILRDAIERTKDPLDKSIVTPEDIIRHVRSNRAMIIFDGLDEKTVHFTPEETNQFIAELWSIREQRSDKENASPQGKILISCRTHYFRDTIEQNTLFLGRDREGRTREEYRSCTLLPFDSAQIREYLEKRIGCDKEKIDRIVELFEKVHNLKDLASRPYTLNLVTESIPDIERKIAEGGHVNTATLYDTTVDNWLARDEGKHEFSTPHKKRLMKSLASKIHRRGGEGLETDELDEWLDKWLYRNPVIKDAYAGMSRETLKKDLRTATFIIREEEDSFSFAHTSLQEYFLAGFIVDALSAKPFEPQELEMKMPAKETLDFVADMLEQNERKSVKMIASLATILEYAYHKEVSELVFALWLKLHERGMRTPATRSVNLEQADLAGWIIGNINLSGARFDGANLRGTSFRKSVLVSVSFNGANLVNAEFVGCTATGADFSQTDAVAATWRNCELSNSIWSSAELRQASFVECLTADTIELTNIKGYSSAHCAGIVNSTFPANTKLSIYDGHSVRIETTSFNPDDSIVASGSIDHTIILWDVKSGGCLMTLTGHIDSVRTAKFSPDGSRILSASEDATIKIWDSNSGMCLLTLSGHEWAVNDCVFSPDGTQIVSASADNTLKLWDPISGICLSTLTGHGNTVWSCAFSPDGSRIVSASADNTLKLWDPISGMCLSTLTGHGNTVWSCAFSPDGSRIVSASADNTLKLWDPISGMCFSTLTGHENTVWSCAFSPDGSRIVSASADNTLRLWDPISGRCSLIIPVPSSWFNNCTFNHDGTKILSTSQGSIKIWNASSGCLLRTISMQGGIIRACAVNNSGTQFITGSNDNSAKLWNADSGRCIFTFSEHSDIVSSCAFSPEGTRIVTASYDNTLKLWNTHSGKCMQTFTGHTSWINDCSFSPDGSKIVSASSDQSLRLWDAHSGKCLMILLDNFDIVLACTFSPEGKKTLSVSRGYNGEDKISLKLWDTETGTILKVITESSRAIVSCAFSPAGNHFLTACLDSNLKLWSSESGKCVQTFKGHRGPVWDCAFSPDGLKMLSASSDNTLKLWNVATGHCERTFVKHNSSVLTCAFTADGSCIISGSSDKTLKLWDAQSGQCLMTMANLSDNETASWSETELKLLWASSNAWRWIGLADGCRRLPIELLDDQKPYN